MSGHSRCCQIVSLPEAENFGFGSGETALCISYHKPHSITCVEIAAEVTGAALKYFKNINLGDLLSKFVSMYHMDAKNFLHLTKKKMAAIVGWRAGTYRTTATIFFLVKLPALKTCMYVPCAHVDTGTASE